MSNRNHITVDRDIQAKKLAEFISASFDKSEFENLTKSKVIGEVREVFEKAFKIINQ